MSILKLRLMDILRGYQFNSISSLNCFLKKCRYLFEKMAGVLKRKMDQLECRLRLCSPDKVIHDGIVERPLNCWDNNPNESPYELMTIIACSRCDRQIQYFWPKSRVNKWIEDNFPQTKAAA